jgi:DNA-binding transcriptional ArsR family regulator
LHWSKTEAILGWRVTRTPYVARTGVDERTASRDLNRLTELGVLVANGRTRGRWYTAGPVLTQAQERLRAGREALEDPHPDLMARIKDEEARQTHPRHTTEARSGT